MPMAVCRREELTRAKVCTCLMFHSFVCINSSYVALKHPSFITDWSKVATLGPLFLIPKQETTTRSTGYPQSGPAEVFSAFVDEEPELLFNSTRESPMTDELDFKTDHETKNGPLVKDLFLNASDLFSSEEGSGFEE